MFRFAGRNSLVQWLNTEEAERMATRRVFLMAAGVAALCRGSERFSSRQRIDRALRGLELDRPAFSLWHHFGLKTPEAHARRTLEFHRAYRTDIVKVMSDFPYPKGSGTKWWELRVNNNPFPDQIRALELIRAGLDGNAYFIETIFNSWNQAEKLSSKQELRRLSRENPAALLDALEAINQSQIQHAKRALSTGASGILFSVANANPAEMSKADYIKFSAPFDRRLLEAISHAKLTTLHLHVDREYLDAVADLPAPVVNYSTHVTGISMADARKRFPDRVLMGGIDEHVYRKLTKDQIRTQAEEARHQSGPKFVLSPGCSVPDDSTPEELARLAEAIGA
jgi:uroporphyrinogen decarboxylase